MTNISSDTIYIYFYTLIYTYRQLLNNPFTVSLTNNPYHKIVSNKNTLFINSSKDNYCANKEYNI